MTDEPDAERRRGAAPRHPEGRDPGRGAPGRSDPRTEGRFKVETSAARFAGVGIQFAVAILVAVFAGRWLDRRLGTGWITIVMMFVGAAAGFYHLYRTLTAEQRR